MALGTTVAAVAVVQFLGLDFGMTLALTSFLGFVAVTIASMAVMVRRSGAAAVRAIGDRTRLLSGHSWQVWPCRVEQRHHKAPDFTVQRMNEVIGVDALVDFRDNAAGHRVHLLAPDGSVFRSYFGVLPDDAWLGMSDGLGAVWVCGDLRFTTLMWTPGAERMWPATPECAVPELAAFDAPSAGGGGTADRTGDRVAEPGVVADIARSAARAAVSSWLG